MRRAMGVVLFAVGMSGCYTSNLVVTIRPDGSGTVDETATIRPAAVLGFQKLASPELAANAQDPATITRQFQGEFERMATAIAREHDITIDVKNPSIDVAAQPETPPAQSQTDTDIFLATLSTAGGKFTVGPPINITNSPGYDNQPSFTPDGKQILFASALATFAPSRDARGASASTPATDIYRYEIASRRTWRVTSTPEGEFSPAVMPDGKNISVVRVEADGTQRLWRVADSNVAKGESSVILSDIKPVGYYAWMDDRTVALFVLGERGQPATLQVADTQTGTAQVVTSDIGRSIQRMPSGSISFVQRQRDPVAGSSGAMLLERLFRSPAQSTVQIEPLVSLPTGSTDPYVAWMPDGAALVAVNSTLYRWRPGVADWTAVANLGAFDLQSVTRLAVSPKGDRLAIVASPK